MALIRRQLFRCILQSQHTTPFAGTHPFSLSVHPRGFFPVCLAGRKIPAGPNVRLCPILPMTQAATHPLRFQYTFHIFLCYAVRKALSRAFQRFAFPCMASGCFWPGSSKLCVPSHGALRRFDAILCSSHLWGKRHPFCCMAAWSTRCVRIKPTPCPFPLCTQRYPPSGKWRIPFTAECICILAWFRVFCK